MFDPMFEPKLLHITTTTDNNAKKGSCVYCNPSDTLYRPNYQKKKKKKNLQSRLKTDNWAPKVRIVESFHKVITKYMLVQLQQKSAIECVWVEKKSKIKSQPTEPFLQIIMLQ